MCKRKEKKNVEKFGQRTKKKNPEPKGYLKAQLTSFHAAARGTLQI